MATATLPPGTPTLAVAQPAPVIDKPGEGRPRSRRYLFECNENTPKEGAFNGTCLVFYNREKGTGDRFFLTVHPTRKRQKDGTFKLVNTRLPTWANVIEEYELERAPQPLRLLPGQAPGTPSPQPQI